MLKSSLFLTLVLSLAAPVVAQNAIKEFLPAGTLLTCTMSEPNFSSKTVQTGDPVLCHLAQVSSFGHPVFPRGAYLTGHLEDSKESRTLRRQRLARSCLRPHYPARPANLYAIRKSYFHAAL